MFGDLFKWDLIDRCRGILHPNGPYVVRPKGNKIHVPDHMMSIDWDQPWIHIRQDDYRYCKLYNDVFITCLNMIPQKCINCWKIVFRPQLLVDMLNLMDFMRKLVDEHGYACKLGMELRPWTSGIYGQTGLWGAYWYTNSQEEGIKCWKTIKEAMEKDEKLKHLLEDVDEDGFPIRLVLKRGCTEFEVGKFGDSKNWKQTDIEKKWERIVWEVFEKQNFSHPQSDPVQHHVIVKWFQHAHHAGDPSVPQLNEGKWVWGGTRYYHKELFDKEEKKSDTKKKPEKESSK